MDNGEKKKCVIYARYSSHAQRDVSIEQQIKEIRKFTDREDLIVIEIYADRALTGTNDRRPQFQRMIKDASMGKFQYVVVYTLDRFARDRYDSALYKRQLKNYGVRVLSAMENISDDPTGILMESMLEGLAEYYSKELSRKISRGMIDNAEKCLICGSLPFGYKRGADGHYAIDEEQAEIVKEIYNRVAEGENLVRICEDLNNRGIRTKTGSRWGRSSFNRLLSNERYLGIYIYGDIRVVDGIPAIIEKELYDKVQLKMTSKSNPRNSPQKRRRENSIYLLTGKLFCGKCKSPMVGISGKSGAKEPYYYYICKKRRYEKTCDKEMVRREWVEKAIAEAIKNYLLNDEVIEWLADCVMDYLKKNKESLTAKTLASQLSEISKSKKNIMAAIEQGIYTETTRERLLELESEEKEISTKLLIENEKTNIEVKREHIIGWLSKFRNGDVEDKDFQETLIDAFLVAAYLYDDHFRLVLKGDGSPKDAEIRFDIDKVSCEAEAVRDVCLSSAQLHQTVQIRTPCFSSNIASDLL